MDNNTRDYRNTIRIANRYSHWLLAANKDSITRREDIALGALSGNFREMSPPVLPQGSMGILPDQKPGGVTLLLCKQQLSCSRICSLMIIPEACGMNCALNVTAVIRCTSLYCETDFKRPKSSAFPSRNATAATHSADHRCPPIGLVTSGGFI
jgi:hypothetical protein